MIAHRTAIWFWRRFVTMAVSCCFASCGRDSVGLILGDWRVRLLSWSGSVEEDRHTWEMGERQLALRYPARQLAVSVETVERTGERHDLTYMAEQSMPLPLLRVLH